MEMLWIDFVNSDWRDPLGRGPATDRLEDSDWLGKFLQAAKLPAAAAARPEARQRLKRLRTLLQAIVAECVAKGSLAPAHLQALNAYLAQAAVHPKLVPAAAAYRIELLSQDEGIGLIEFTIAASLARYLTTEDIARLKLCENANCRWLFVDQTRSHTRRWCASSCGNLIKVRQFRQRKAQKKQSRGKSSRRSSKKSG